MRRRILVWVAYAAIAANGVANSMTTALAGDFSRGPFSPELLVPTPILRKKACGADYSVPCCRGVAILSPVESPDHCDPGVGGKTVLTPYYPDYCVHSCHGPRVFVPRNGIGYYAPRGKPLEPGEPVMVSEPSGPAYGAFAGARQDEANLSHLGGFSDPGVIYEPSQPDMVDLIEGCR